MLEPDLLGTSNEIVLNGDGSSRYRQAEVTAKFAWSDGQNMVLSYVHSRAEGSQNVFDNFLGNYALPVFRPDVYANLPGDVPNRFLAWGRTNVPIWNLKLLPIIECRTGFPYAVYDQFQNYSGVPNRDSTRLPNFISVDARLMRDFKVTPKYTVRLSVTGSNLTNHFNALAIHNNLGDQQYGVFFGNNHRRYRFDFEFVL